MGHCGKNSRKFRSITLPDKPEYAMNEARPEGVTSAREPLNITQLDRSSAMPLKALISLKGDSASKSNIAPVTPAKWQSIGDLARALVTKAEGGK